MALKRPVILSPGSYATATQNSYKATDGITAVDETGSTGQVCTIGSSGVPPWEMPSNDFHDQSPAGTAGSAPNSQCTGTVIQLEMMTRSIVEARTKDAGTPTSLYSPSYCWLQTYSNASNTELDIKMNIPIPIYPNSEAVRRLY